MLRKLIEIVVLARSVDHSPALLFQFADLVEHRNRLVAADDLPQHCHSDQSTGPTHPSAAVNHRNTSFQIADQPLQQKSHTCAFLRGFSIDPVVNMVVRNMMNTVSLAIFQLHFFDPDIGVFRMHIIFHYFYGVLSDCHETVVVGQLGVVPVTFFLFVFQQSAQHEDRRNLVLFDHSPKITDCNGERSLCCYGPFFANVYHIGVYVVLDFVAVWVVISQSHSSRFKSHKCGMSVQGKLVRIFIQFIDMFLCLRHKRQQLKLRTGASVHSFEGKFDLLHDGPHLFQILILVHPFLRDIVVIHLVSKEQGQIIIMRKSIIIDQKYAKGSQGGAVKQGKEEGVPVQGS